MRRLLSLVPLLLLWVTTSYAVIDDPVLWWKMDEGSGTTLVNSGSGGTITGTFGGTAPTRLSGANCKTGFGGCLGFTAPNQQVTFSHATGTTFTWAAWVYSAAAGSAEYPGLWTSSANALVLNQGATGNANKLNYWYASADHYSTGTVTPRETWIHVALVNNAGALTYYIGGNPSGTASSAPGFTATCMGANCTGWHQLIGRLDDLRVYSRPLSGSDITELVAWVPPVIVKPVRRLWRY